MTELKTSRLILRSCTTDDTKDVLGILGDADTAWWADIKPFEDEFETRFFINWGNRSGTVLQLALTHKDTGEVLGLIQAKDPFYFGHRPGVVELGYLLSPKARGKGYMSEAVKALCDHLFEDQTVREVILEILADNRGSVGVARRCGFTHVDQKPWEKELRSLDSRPLERFSLPREAHSAMKQAA